MRARSWQTARQASDRVTRKKRNAAAWIIEGTQLRGYKPLAAAKKLFSCSGYRNEKRADGKVGPLFYYGAYRGTVVLVVHRSKKTVKQYTCAKAADC